MKSYFEAQFSDCLAKGLSLLAASETAAHSFLDGKPQRSGKAKVTNADRHAAFWSREIGSDWAGKLLSK
jgi:hypothetical protein